MKILRADDRSQILTRARSDREWEATFPNHHWDYHRFGALAAALEQTPVLGREVTGMKESGDVYEFFFSFRNRQLYGKINLRPSRQEIIIYSSHPPNQGDTL